MAKVLGTISVNKVTGKISVNEVTGEISYQQPFGVVAVNPIAVRGLTGTVIGAAITSGTMQAVGSLSGSLAGAAILTGAASGKGSLFGTALGLAALTGLMQGKGVLSGTITAAAITAGTLTGTGALSGSITGAATATGTLTPPAGYCAEYQVVYDSWTNKPADAVAVEHNTMVEDWISDGIWAIRDVLYVFAAHTNNNGEALTNWRNPGTNDATMVNAPAFVAFEGFTGDGATQYILPNFFPNTDATNYVVDDASVAGYTRTDNADTGLFWGLELTTYLYPLLAGRTYYRLNYNVNVILDPYPGNSSGMWITTRQTGVDDHILYRNKSPIKSINSATEYWSTAGQFSILASYNLSIPAAWTDRQVSMFTAGGGLTQTNVNNLTDPFETYMVSNGKGAI